MPVGLNCLCLYYQDGMNGKQYGRKENFPEITKKTFRSAAKNRDGWTKVNTHIFGGLTGVQLLYFRHAAMTVEPLPLLTQVNTQGHSTDGTVYGIRQDMRRGTSTIGRFVVMLVSAMTTIKFDPHILVIHFKASGLVSNKVPKSKDCKVAGSSFTGGTVLCS